MSLLRGQHSNAPLALALVIVLVVSIADLFVPLGVAIWLGYLLALLVAAYLGRPRQLLLLVFVCSILIALGLVLPDPRAEFSPAAFVDRSMGIGLLWLIALLRIRGQKAEEALEQRTYELAQAYEELRTLSLRIIEVQEHERRILGQELHDEAGQALTALKLELSLLARQPGCPETVVARAQELQRQVDGIMEGLHRMAVNLRPPSLDRLGLVPALRQYVEELGRDGDLLVDLETVGLGEERLPPDVEASVYRVVQEALTNVVRHARATHAGVVVQRAGDAVRAVVEDDGVGLDPALARQDGHLGLLGMQERAELLGGRFTLESTPGHGTTVVAEIPCKQRAPC